MYHSFALFAALLISSAASLCAQTGGERFIRVVKLLREEHLDPKTQSTANNDAVVRLFMLEADPRRLLFTEKHLDSVSQAAPAFFKGDNAPEIETFLLRTRRFYSQRCRIAAENLHKITAKAPVFSRGDTLRAYYTHQSYFAPDEKALLKRYRNLLHFSVLSEASARAADKNESTATVAAREGAALQQKEKDRMLCIIQRFEKDSNACYEMLEAALCDAFARLHDPHSNFFSKQQYRQFMTGLASDAFSYGFVLGDDEEDQVRIEHLNPGGPAWKSSQVHEGDILHGLSDASGNAADLSCKDAAAIEELIQSLPGNRITLELKTAGGTLQRVTLTKGLSQVEENRVTGFILEGERNIGYIHLPAFYTGWEKQFGLGVGCANDVSKEILKLGGENIEGLILDLRFNGGGALSEAADLAGAFIDVGPVCIMEQQGNPPFVYKETTRGTVFQKPLIILVNSYSASASEIVSGVLQDHGRAIIAGSPTYGKSTGQRVIAVDETNAAAGFLKVTDSYFYSPDGDSHQQKGIVPDILIPDPYMAFASAESEAENALPNKSSDKNVYFSFPEIPYLDSLQQRSRKRLAGSGYFRQVDTLNAKIGLEKKNGISYVLSPAAFDPGNTLEELRSLLASPQKEEAPYTAAVNAYLQERLNLDPVLQEQVRIQKEELLLDMTLRETYRVMLDYITFAR